MISFAPFFCATDTRHIPAARRYRLEGFHGTTDRNPTLLNRRNMLKLIVAGLASHQFPVLPVITGAAVVPKIHLGDPWAQALGCVHDAGTVDASMRADDARNCASCRFYTQPDFVRGRCHLSPGKAVSKIGWSKEWVEQA